MPLTQSPATIVHCEDLSKNLQADRRMANIVWLPLFSYCALKSLALKRRILSRHNASLVQRYVLASDKALNCGDDPALDDNGIKMQS